MACLFPQILPPKPALVFLLCSIPTPALEISQQVHKAMAVDPTIIIAFTICSGKAIYCKIRQALIHFCRRTNNYFVTLFIWKCVVLFATKIMMSEQQEARIM